jgi:flagellar hook assembly protein FlgD
MSAESDMARPHPHKRVARAATISILTLIATLAAIWLAPRASDAVAAWVRTPQVRTQTIALSAALPVEPSPGASGDSARTAVSPADGAWAEGVTVDPGLRFNLVGIICRPLAQAVEVVVRIRTSLDGRSWGAWYSASLEVVTEGGGSEPQAYTEPLWTGDGRYVQLAARRGGGGQAAPLALRDVKVVALNSTENADLGSSVLGVVRRTAAVVAGLELVAPARAMTKQPTIVTRAEWGADESYRSGSPSFGPVKMVFVHHTDSGNDYTRAEAPAIVRAVYAYHTRSLHWSDVGYNFLIDRYGTVYEGRYGGVTKGAIGAQTLGFNTGSIGVSVIGTFTKATPPAAAVSALEGLLAWKLDVHHVDPQGTAAMVCGYGQKYATGQSVSFPVIAGHRDANYTDCPGGKLYALLPAIRKAVAAIGQPKIYGLDVANATFSPNGDAVRDKVQAAFTLSEGAAWTVEIHDAAGAIVRRMTGQGTDVTVTWAGKDDQGAGLPDGIYTLVAGAKSASGEARPAAVDLHLDTTPPHLASAQIAPSPFSPNGDGHDDVTTVSFAPAERGTARVSVIGAGDKVVRLLTDWRSVGATVQTVAWDGQISEGAKLVAAAEGPVSVEIALRDLAGNTATFTREVVVDRTLGFPVVSPRICSPNGDGVRDTVAVAFSLTRQANVTVTFVHGADILSAIKAGALSAGPHSVTWDGTVTGGAYPASGDYELRVTARGTIGVTSVSEPVTVDRYAPRLTAPAGASSKAGKTAKIPYSVRDPYSSTVKVTVVVSDASGVSVATVACGWVKQGTAATLTWRPPVAGTYTLTFTAVDRGGNPEGSARVTVLKAS